MLKKRLRFSSEPLAGSSLAITGLETGTDDGGQPEQTDKQHQADADLEQRGQQGDNSHAATMARAANQNFFQHGSGFLSCN